MIGRRETLFAVAAETVTAGRFQCAWSGSGVPMKGQLLGELGGDTVNRDLDIRELWNQEDPFGQSRSRAGRTC
jgi:hypothetical protein